MGKRCPAFTFGARGTPKVGQLSKVSLVFGGIRSEPATTKNARTDHLTAAGSGSREIPGKNALSLHWPHLSSISPVVAVADSINESRRTHSDGEREESLGDHHCVRFNDWNGTFRPEKSFGD